MDGLLSVVDGIDRGLFVWYDQTATVDGVKGNDNRVSTTVEHWYKAMVGGYSDRLRRRTDGRGMISGHMYRRGGHKTGQR